MSSKQCISGAALLLSVVLVAGPIVATEAASELPAPVLDSIDVALEHYEEVRAALAADSLDGVGTSATRLATALRPALSNRAELVEEIPSLIEDATFMAESIAAAEDLDGARASFAELSRSFLLLAQYDERVTEGRHVFSCPMVESFEKWIQPAAELENPYMGQSMLACGTTTDWSASEAESWLASAEPGAPGEPRFEAGIPGLKMVDVRDYKFLWREIDELQRWERGERITVAEYREKVIEKTAHFLELDSEGAGEFIATGAAAVESVRQAFKDSRKPGPTHVGERSGFRAHLQSAADRVTSMLGDAPRHQLFEPEVKKWLLKMSFGPRELKESREAP